jgi:hypothetical protein
LTDFRFIPFGLLEGHRHRTVNECRGGPEHALTHLGRGPVQTPGAGRHRLLSIPPSIGDRLPTCETRPLLVPLVTQIGKQPLSLSRTMPAYGFGSSDRDKESARFVSSQHAKVLRGSFSPNNYDRQQQTNLTSFGKQSLSVRTNVPAHVFGSQPRMVFKTSQTPVRAARRGEWA